MKARIGLFLAALALCVAYPGAARADRLDKKLVEEMPAIYEHLKTEKGYQNVGVLRFRVQKGTKPARFDNAPLNGNLATRLENLLVLQGSPEEKKALGVIHEPGATASKEKLGGWYGSVTDRKKLFGLDYPLAWGKQKVKADAFLTGLVKTSRDLKKVTVTIVCFDKASPADFHTVKQFVLDTDRNLIRDLGYSFALSRGQRNKLVAKRGTADQTDTDSVIIDAVQQGDGKDDVIPQGKQPDNKQPDNKQPDDKKPDEGTPDQKKPGTKPQAKPTTQVTPSNIAGIEFRMLVDNVGQEVRPGAGQDGAAHWQVDCPAPGKPVVIALKNTTDKRLGVVFRVNGLNTVNQQKDAPESCKKWVIPPYKTYFIKGFYMSDGDSEDNAPVSRGKKAAKRGGDEDDDGPKNTEGQKQDDKPAGGKDLRVTTILPFKVLVGEEANALKAEYGEKYGLLEVDVFAEGGETATDDTLQVSSKGLPPSKEKLARSSHKALRTALLKSSKLRTETNRVTKRSVLVPDPEKAVKVTGLTKVDFSGHPVGHLAIKIVPSDSKPIEE
jgi:hypothetical protein